MVKTITNKNMFQMANDILKYVKTNYTLPNKLTYNGTNFYKLEMAYIISYGIYHLRNPTITIPNYEEYAKYTGDKVNIKIPKTGYLDMAKRVFNHIEKYKKCPGTVRYGNYKINIELYIASMSKAINYYWNHKTLPDTCNFYYNDFIKPEPPKPQKKKYGHATEPCCDDRGQNTDYYCACHSLQEVFRNLTGIVVPQSTIASVCGTTSAGTGHGGMDSCVAWFNRKYGYNLKAEWKNFSDLGWSGINNIINSNDKDCIIHNLYRDQWGHYEVINGIDGDTVIVQNSLGDYCRNGCHYGYIEYRSKSVFRRYISGISQKSIMVITNA